MSANIAGCPICEMASSVVKIRDYGERTEIDCPRCGRYEITGTASQTIGGKLHDRPEGRAALSHAVRQMQRSAELPQIDSKNIETLASRPLPTPQEQADNFIMWVGSCHGADPGKRVEVVPQNVAAVIGGIDGSATSYIASELERQGLIRGSINRGGVWLTLEGWDRYHELTRATVDSRQAFMAMPFGDRLLDRIFDNYWRPAVAATGFELRRLTDKQRAGLIDDRLRVEIRRSRFLISEITGQNRGAYWEAGFAEGLDRPVIYTCKKSEFKKAHFDTNHCLTILWEEDKLEEAVEELKACIRETLPTEAVMADPEPEE